MIRIAFFGTWDFSKNILDGILKHKNIQVSLVVSQPDKEVWRKKIKEETPVKVLAKQKNIEIIQPNKLRDNLDFFDKLKSLNLDFIIVVAYGKIIPKEVIEVPKYDIINIHWSILPKYRWASPIQEAIKNWDIETWLSIMKIAPWMDEWDVYEIQKVKIDIFDKTPEIFKKFEDIWVDLLIKNLLLIKEWKIKAIPQNNKEATYCSKIEKVNWKVAFQEENATQIYNKFRAYYLWPWIYSYYNWKKIDFTDCFFLENVEQNKLWSVLKLENWEIWVQARKWILIIKKIKLEWKKELSIKDFINWNKQFLDYNFD